MRRYSPGRRAGYIIGLGRSGIACIRTGTIVKVYVFFELDGKQVETALVQFDDVPYTESMLIETLVLIGGE